MSCSFLPLPTCVFDDDCSKQARHVRAVHPAFNTEGLRFYDGHALYRTSTAVVPKFASAVNENVLRFVDEKVEPGDTTPLRCTWYRTLRVSFQCQLSFEVCVHDFVCY